MLLLTTYLFEGSRRENDATPPHQTRTTIFDGVTADAGKGTTVTYDCAGDGIGSFHQVAVVVVGEAPHTEGPAARPGDLRLGAQDFTTFAKLKAGCAGPRSEAG
ncbi:MAG TPA: hypothetical protein VGL64_13230, partial [Amycolatopsis sp.]